MSASSEGSRQPDREIVPSKQDNSRLREQATRNLSNLSADRGPGGGVASSARGLREQQEELDRLLDPKETQKLYAANSQNNTARGDKTANASGEEQDGSSKDKASKKGGNESTTDKTAKQERSGLNERINNIIATQPPAKAAENLRSMIFDLYNPKGSPERDNFIQNLKNSGREADANALAEKGIAPPFDIGTQGSNPLDSGRTTSREFSSSTNPKDTVSVFNTSNPDVIGMVTDKSVIVLDTKNMEYREIPLDPNRIKGNPADKEGTWSHNLMVGELSLEQQADKLARVDPVKAAQLYQQAFRLSDQRMKNRGVAPDSLEAAEEHRHRGLQLSGVRDEKGVDEAAAANEYKLAGKIYEKLKGPDHIDAIRNKFDLLAASTKAFGATESNKRLFEELRQRRTKGESSEQENDLFDQFMIRHLDMVEGLFPPK